MDQIEILKMMANVASKIEHVELKVTDDQAQQSLELITDHITNLIDYSTKIAESSLTITSALLDLVDALHPESASTEN